MEKDLSKDELRSLRNEIQRLLKKTKALVLAHNYQRPEVQDIAHLCGDSLELSIKASETDAEIIVFCGVHFMAETASILCPDKKVLLPVPNAGCPMADMITAEELKSHKQGIPEAVIVSYVNTSADVKAESDVCCTSANALQVVESIKPGFPILMVPDKNLAQYTIRHTNREITYWEGFCPIHNYLNAEHVKKVRDANPDAVFLAHPECPPDVIDLADHVKSTSGMISYARASSREKFIIGTEVGLLYPLSRANPGKVFIPADASMVCPDMKKINLVDIVRTLEKLAPEVRVPNNIRVKAKLAVDRMLAIPPR
jgi:quinolinate synthase